MRISLVLTFAVSLAIPGILACGCSGTETASGRSDSDPAVGDLAGNVRVLPSEEPARDVAEWRASFRSVGRDVRATVVTKGCAMAPTFLVNGEEQSGPMSRTMTAGEAGRFEQQLGTAPGPTGPERR